MSELGFCDALLTGLAHDGGLYMPKSWPKIDQRQICSMVNQSYEDIAKTVLRPFVQDEIETDVFNAMVENTYTSFHHASIVPLVQIARNHFIAELFHGPTLAFKDIAMQLLARLMDHVLSHRNERATIIGATSGDTGGAAIEAFRGCNNVDIFILFPLGKVSSIQQRQITTLDEANVHAIAIDGNFDDCQSLVKALFNHHEFRDTYKIAGVNSINWARIMAQTVYYFSAASLLGCPQRELSFTVPTGNFGDIFAGFVAKQMGLPIKNLIIATNQNDILVRTLESGQYEVDAVISSTSPSMDIQRSSNFERLLFEAEHRDGDAIQRMMLQLSQSGSFCVPSQALEFIRKLFKAGRCDDVKAAQTIKQTLVNSNYLLDPHTAVGVAVANEFLQEENVMVTLSTAHPAKFPKAVRDACGISPELPEWVGGLMERKEQFSVLGKDQDGLEDFIRKHSHHI